MNSQRMLANLFVCVVLVLVTTHKTHAGQADPPPSTAFTYYGQLKFLDNPLNATADFRFTPFDRATGGEQVGPTIDRLEARVTDGIIQTELDFGTDPIAGPARWFQIQIRTPTGKGVFTTLSPRQPIRVIDRPARSVGQVNRVDPNDLGTAEGSANQEDRPDQPASQRDVEAASRELDQPSIEFDPWWPLELDAEAFAPEPPDLGERVNGTPGTPGDGDDGDWILALPNIYRLDGTVGIGTGYSSSYKLNIRTDLPRGINAWSTGASGVGVLGGTSGSNGRGVFGLAWPTSGINAGVFGLSKSTSGRGVQGYASASSGWTIGAVGQSVSSRGTGVWGIASSTTGFNVGVRASTSSSQGWALYTTGGRNYFQGNVGIGTTPAHPLDVNGIIRSRNGGIMFPNGTVQTTAAGGPGSGSASGDISGIYPGPITVVGLRGRSVSSGMPSTGEVLKWTGSQWAPGTDIIGPGGDGDITAVRTNGPYLNGGAESGDANLTLDSSVLGSHFDARYVNEGQFATGDLSASYPSPLVDGLQGNPVSPAAPSNGQVLMWNGSEWAPGGGTGPRIEFAELDDGPNLTTQWQVMVQVTINAPTSGKIHVVANGALNIPSNDANLYIVGISLSPSASPINMVQRVKAYNQDFSTDVPVTTQYVRSVSAGSHTFYMTGRRFASGGICATNGLQISATFIAN